MTKRISALVAAVTIIGSSVPAFADHANPWAGPDDEVKSQYHDSNQARSVDTPGQDEMRGVMTRNAFGKTGGTTAGSGGGAGNDNGGKGSGGAGKSGAGKGRG